MPQVLPSSKENRALRILIRAAFPEPSPKETDSARLSFGLWTAGISGHQSPTPEDGRTICLLATDNSFH